ncbi:helix-turn-helix transcriptional regulator [Accumulibacter sp.]|uniref:helix-turn-helix domain-containing protein n=1 Tax=Accumulibacter sp. TaxID=2053492 RepID=UPI0025E480BD|nr:helix-turn-helix transcriptional regulator [Accumulibacter sp.]MCM8626719.1 helix-turn-helix domain-containing protein [Accumulibacter sp.]
MSNASVFGSRLRAARVRSGLTQMQLGVMAKIDEYSASARVNQYERGKHHPDFATAERLAEVLGVPVGYLYTSDETLAELILVIGRLDSGQRQDLLRTARILLETP